ncbi:MAG: hypothetical protein Q9159_004208 [Coniocarpon cinnabarinum]
MDTTTDSPASAKARRRKANYTDHNLSSTNPNNAITQASQTTSFDRRIPPPNPAVTTSPSNSNRTKSAGYAPPSKYAHLPHLTDVLAPNLLILFVGLNPGITTATEGKSSTFIFLEILSFSPHPPLPSILASIASSTDRK